MVQRLMVVIVAVVLLFSVSLSAHCTIIYVKPSGNNLNSGLSWDDAKKTITSGLFVATNLTNDEVWVAAGTYNERITLKVGVALYGGFTGSEIDRNQRNWSANICIIDANQAGTAITSPINATNATRIDGFTIYNGNGTNGGGIYCSNSSPTITNNTIVGNSASAGAGIYCSNSSSLITNNTVKTNIAKNYGGGIYCTGTAAPTITNNTIIENDGLTDGGGIYTTNAAVISNNIIAFNTSGIFKSGAASATLRNNDVFGNDRYNYSGIAPGEGDISSDPAIINNSYRSCHIRADSPCVNAGWNDAAGIQTTDIDGGDRIIDGTADIGADESDGSNPASHTWTPTVIIRVAPEGNDSNDGSSWALAKLTVQAGLNTAVYGGEVWIKSGTYIGQITLKNGVSLYGGFAGNETECSERDAATNVTILDGNGSGTVVATPNVSTRLTSIDGFTVRNGSVGIFCSYGSIEITNNIVTENLGRGIGVGNAAAMISDNKVIGNSGTGISVGSGSHCKIENNMISSNYAGLDSGSRGGGIYCSGVWENVIGNTITGNTAGYGGGIMAGLGSVITGNIISGNNAKYMGGGIYNESGYPVITNNVVRGNSSYGAGIACNSGSSATIADNAIICNTGTDGAGGILCMYLSRPTITNNTIVGNTLTSTSITPNGGGIICSSTSKITNNIIAFNASGLWGSSSSSAPTLRNNLVYGNGRYDYMNMSQGVGDMMVDPGLANAAYGDFHLRAGSPCINAGLNDASGLPATDIDGNDRIIDGIVDIGAVEYNGSEPSPYSPAIVRVSTEGNDANDGSSWTLAKRTIQAGLKAVAMQGGEVWVKAGVYSERITIGPYCYLYGGFAGNETDLSEREWKLNETIIDGGNNGCVVVIYGTMTPSACICIDGFTVRNGKKPGSGEEFGGGIRCDYSTARIANNKITENGSEAYAVNYGAGISSSHSSLEIVSNTISKNYALYYGGGIYCVSCSGTVKDNIIDQNSVSIDCGGGIFCSRSSIQITCNSITNNFAWTRGAGIGLASDNSICANNIIAGNKSCHYGAGICGIITSAIITNNTIADNEITGTTNTNAAGIYCDQVSTPVIGNNILAFNSSGIGCSADSTLTLRNNDMFGNGELNYYSLSPGPGDISLDPLFIDRANGDYHLSVLSPCINAGSKDAPSLPSIDFDNEPRIQGAIVDIGADECWLKAGSLKDAKRVADDILVDIDGLPVTAAFPDFFYVENTDRSSGIRVDKAAHGLLEGSKAHLIGSVKTWPSGERYIAAETINSAGSGSVTPLMLNNSSIGGGRYGLQTGVFGWDLIHQPDNTMKLEWLESNGLNNVGLLIKTFGKVTFVGADYFYIDDGSGLNDNSGNKGIKVYGIVPVVENEDPIGKFVTVTGISSCEKPGSDPIRIIRSRGVGDVLILN